MHHTDESYTFRLLSAVLFTVEETHFLSAEEVLVLLLQQRHQWILVPSPDLRFKGRNMRSATAVPTRQETSDLVEASRHLTHLLS